MFPLASCPSWPFAVDLAEYRLIDRLATSEAPIRQQLLSIVKQARRQAIWDFARVPLFSVFALVLMYALHQVMPLLSLGILASVALPVASPVLLVIIPRCQTPSLAPAARASLEVWYTALTPDVLVNLFHQCPPVASKLVQELGPRAKPALAGALAHSSPTVRQFAFAHLRYVRPSTISLLS